ncbi:MAG: flagellar protein FlaG [Proteobacteria bacterium]|nr:flagellar protein FlaG [Pseudomonadota bacterium]
MQVDAKNIISDFESAVVVSVPQKREHKKTPQLWSVQSEPVKVNEETKRKIEGMIKELTASKQLNMYYDNDLDRVVVTIINGESQEVVRQVPSSEFISFMKKFNQFVGLMINRRV